MEITDPPEGSFLASQPVEPEEHASLEEIVTADAEQQLSTALADLEELVAGIRARDGDHVDPQTAALLEAISGSPDAGVQAASIHRKVHEGALTWAGFCAAPQDHPGGVALWTEALRARTEVWQRPDPG